MLKRLNLNKFLILILYLSSISCAHTLKEIDKSFLKEEKNHIRLGCVRTEAFLLIVVNKEKETYPAMMPPGCRCFIAYKDIEYVTTAPTKSKECNKNE